MQNLAIYALSLIHIYQVFMPKEGNTFLRHEVFGRLYLKQMGKQVYEFNKLCFAHDLDVYKRQEEAVSAAPAYTPIKDNQYQNGTNLSLIHI